MAEVFPVVVVDKSGIIVFCNDAWEQYQRLVGVPSPFGVGLPYSFTLAFNDSTAADRYARATIDQGLEEVLHGIEFVYTREYVFHNSLGRIKFRLMFTPTKLTNGTGAIIWAEYLSGSGPVEVLMARLKKQRTNKKQVRSSSRL